MTGNIRKKEYERFYNDRTLNLLFQLKPLDNEDCEAILADEQLFSIASVCRHPKFIQYLSEKYEATESIVNRVLDYDLRSWAVSMRKQNMLGKVVSARDRVIQRLEVWYKNKKALERVLNHFEIPRNSYLDVGCLLGLTLANAAQAGFKRVVGVEILPYYKAFADEFIPTVQKTFNVEAEYIIGDICVKPNSEEQFNLICCVDVLEHTPDFALTMRRLCELCSDHGRVYIYQGNGQSLFFAIMEPHYRLPCISILPEELSIRLLEHLGAVSEETPYVVEQWPTLEEISREAHKNGFSLSLVDDEINIRNDGRYPGKSKASEFIQRYKQLLDTDLYPHLSEKLKDEVEIHVNAYETQVGKDLDNLDEVAFRRKYMMDSWNIALAPNRGHD